MANPIQSFLDDYEHGDVHNIPEQSRSVCCCGNEACAYLQHNQSAACRAGERCVDRGTAGQGMQSPI